MMLDMHRCCYCLSVIAEGDSVGRCGRARTWQKSISAQISVDTKNKVVTFFSERQAKKHPFNHLLFKVFKAFCEKFASLRGAFSGARVCGSVCVCCETKMKEE